MSELDGFDVFAPCRAGHHHLISVSGQGRTDLYRCVTCFAWMRQKTDGTYEPEETP